MLLVVCLINVGFIRHFLFSMLKHVKMFKYVQSIRGQSIKFIKRKLHLIFSLSLSNSDMLTLSTFLLQAH